MHDSLNSHSSRSIYQVGFEITGEDVKDILFGDLNISATEVARRSCKSLPSLSISFY